MSQVAFQTALARLLIDPQFSHRLQSEPEAALRELNGRERTRILALVEDPGFLVARKLHRAWRLSKLLTLLPKTCLVVADEVLAREVDNFWSANPPRSLYFLDEALMFGDRLAEVLGQDSDHPYVREVVEFEQANLRLKHVYSAGAGGPASLTVNFSHDPSVLLTRLASGQAPGAAPERSCTLVGTLDGSEVKWRLAK